ncbi:peroxisome proliferator-activated receptor gamma coactivator 1-alpha isoform X2 [Protopterus annectens]|uniref:peroxisome proliferator-activated receptor gamma coactivator 1-alpha isoform X2 n=1 Tax=Protopterus annectens TaxID=7888 RepID=UPI001CF9CF43|nr:peroxisome proliferator-activated receptor gamma coactivator 1-alpha isoform X2 [Protopterus annectens]
MQRLLRINCTALVGEDQPLCSDLPELDLSELDVNELNADSFLCGFKWYGDQPEIISSQYCNESSSLFEKIDDENEANLLAALTETLESIPVDEDGLPSFEALAEGGVPTMNDPSPPVVPDGAPPTPEAEEPSLLKKLLLAPLNAQLNSNECRGLAVQTQVSTNQKLRMNSAVVKMENSWNNKARGICQQQKSQRRPCSELLKYLTACDDNPSQTKLTDNRISNKERCISKKKPSLQSHQSYHSQAKPTMLSLPLTPDSPNDPKSSPFENKTIEQTLSVELSGTAGLTPPTTPPHKASQDNPFKTSLKPVESFKSSQSPVKKQRFSDPLTPQGNCPLKKGPEQTELYAQLSKTSVLINGPEERKGKRPSLRLFGDHDYCQAVNAKADIQITVSQDSQYFRQSVGKYNVSHGHQLHLHLPSVQTDRSGKETQQLNRHPDQLTNNRKHLQDQEIRDELNRHFGHPNQAFFDKSIAKFSESQDNDASANFYSKLPLCINAGMPANGIFDESEDDGDKLLYSWDGEQADVLFEECNSCSPYSSPRRGSVSPPKSLFLKRTCRGRSRSRSFSRHRSCSRSSYSHSRSRSPHSRSSSRSCYCDSDNLISRSSTSPCSHSRSRSRSPYRHRTRYDSYEEYQHERLKREEYRRDYEKREFERAKQRERQKQKAIEERRVIYIDKLRSGITRTELKRRFEVFGEIEECTVNLRDDGDSYGFITYRYTCDAFAALENGYTLRRSSEPRFEMCFGGRKQFCKSEYTDLDCNLDDFDPASTKSKYDSMDFDSLLREAQRSLRR